MLVACAVMGTGTYMATAKASAAVGRYQIGNERVIDTIEGVCRDHSTVRFVEATHSMERFEDRLRALGIH